MRTKLTSLPMINDMDQTELNRNLKEVIKQAQDINIARMRITLSFVILIFPKRVPILMGKMITGHL